MASATIGSKPHPDQRMGAPADLPITTPSMGAPTTPSMAAAATPSMGPATTPSLGPAATPSLGPALSPSMWAPSTPLNTPSPTTSGLSLVGRYKWRLSRAATVLIVAWVSLFILLASLLPALAFETECEDGADPAWGLGALLMRGVAVALTGAAAGCYVWVATRAARPAELHVHGFVLLLMLPELVGLMMAQNLHCQAMYKASYLDSGLFCAVWGIRRALFFMLMMHKMAALGPPVSRCIDALPWGRALIGTWLLAFLGGLSPWWLWQALLLQRGCTVEDLPESASDIRDWGVSTADKAALGAFISVKMVGQVGSVVAGTAFVYVSWRLICAAKQRMVKRGVPGEQLDKVRSTLFHHLVGVCISIFTTQFLVGPAAIADLLNLFGEDLEKALLAMAHLLDIAGDIAGILLLSGIGVLLGHEDPEAGDVTGHIRGVLHSAVLTSRADTAFEGKVATNPGRCCIASFPGKYLKEWNALTWLCEQGELSSACVFLPKADPKERFGRHVPCDETPGYCWCHSLYGAVKPWGCLWFDCWRQNIEEAVSLGLDLVVVFFPRQAGKGLVTWDELKRKDLWNGVGLGGSQKAEVAYLIRRGYNFHMEGLETTRLRICVAQCSSVSEPQ